MQYKIFDIIIKSENSAKSHKQQSLFLKKLIVAESNINSFLDYGCGKLRYSETIVSKSDRQVFVDSKAQLDRLQIIHNSKTSVKEYVKSNYHNASVYAIDDLSNLNEKFDFILCSNVISAVPCDIERAKIFGQIKRLLNKEGRALFVCQYDDVYFKSYRHRANCTRYLDGYIIQNKNIFSFYGLVTPEILEKLLVDNGFRILEKINKKGSIYIYVN